MEQFESDNLHSTLLFVCFYHLSGHDHAMVFSSSSFFCLLIRSLEMYGPDDTNRDLGASVFVVAN